MGFTSHPYQIRTLLSLFSSTSTSFTLNALLYFSDILTSQPRQKQHKPILTWVWTFNEKFKDIFVKKPFFFFISIYKFIKHFCTLYSRILCADQMKQKTPKALKNHFTKALSQWNEMPITSEGHDMKSMLCYTNWPSNHRNSMQSIITGYHPSHSLYINITNRNNKRTYKRDRGGWSTRVQGF